MTRQQRDAILEEARQWVLVAENESTETLYWHDDDFSRWTSTKEIEDYYKKAVVIKDGHFIGALIDTEDVSSMGLSVYRSREYGILYTDGRKIGKTEEYFSHSSDEIAETSDTNYSLKHK